MTTPLQVFEAYIGRSIAEWIVYGRMLNEYLIEDLISDLERTDVNVPCECEDGEIEVKFQIGDDSEVMKISKMIKDTHAKAIEIAVEYLSELIDELTLGDILNDYTPGTHGSINSYEKRIFRETIDVARQIHKLESHYGYTEGHVNIAKKNKKLFKDIFLERIPSNEYYENWLQLLFSPDEVNNELAMNMIESKNETLPKELFDHFRKLIRND